MSGFPGLGPAPDPVAVAAGAPLRATLLAQIAEFGGRCAAIPAASARSCSLYAGQFSRPPELIASVGWRQQTDTCAANPRSDTDYVLLTVVVGFTPESLRQEGTLDASVAGSTWCGRTGPTPAR